MIALHQPVTLAAMEALFETQPGAPLVISSASPNVTERRDRQSAGRSTNAELSDLRRWEREVKGLNAFPEDHGPTTSRCFITAITSWSAWGRSSSPSWWLRRFCCGAGNLYAVALDALDPDAQPCHFPTSPTPPAG